MNRCFFLLIVGIAAMSCHKAGPDFKFGKLDTNMLNKVISRSELIDRTVLRPDHLRIYLNRSNGIKTYITRNDSGWIEMIEQTRKEISLFESEYYSNGQQTGDFPRGSNGMLTGPATYYYRDGKISCTGKWKDWGQVGEWKYYDENGKLTKTEMKGQPDKSCVISEMI
ncbi:MAG TPA: hypothetical protein VGM89_01445 [Puia sp.]